MLKNLTKIFMIQINLKLLRMNVTNSIKLRSKRPLKKDYLKKIVDNSIRK